MKLIENASSKATKRLPLRPFAIESVVTADYESVAHCYSIAEGPGAWRFVVPGELFVILEHVGKDFDSYEVYVGLDEDGALVAMAVPLRNSWRIL